MAPFAWNVRDLHCQLAVFDGPAYFHLVRNLVQVVFAFGVLKRKTPRCRGA